MTDEIEQVGPVDPKLKTSAIIESLEPVDEDNTDRAAICWFNGAKYTQGAQVCSAGRRLYCHSSGTWTPSGSC